MMPFNADGCAMVIDSPHGRLLHLSFPMMYLMAQLNDGILAEATFNLVDEFEETSERIVVRIRVEKVS